MKWLFAVVQAAQMTAGVSHAGNNLMPPAGTQIASQVDNLYTFILIASFVACVLVIGGMVYFALKYKRRTDNDKTPYISHNTFLEFLWSFIPLVIFLGIFGWGWHIYHQMRQMPTEALEVHVTGYKWAWDFEYKSGKKTSNEFTVPVGVPVKLIMTSKDVIHSFYIPSMRIKQDVVPGRYTAEWFTADKTGDYQVFCTEYCGDMHSRMLAKIHIVTQDEYNKWIQENDAALSMVERGQKHWMTKCSACHQIDGVSTGLGPNWKGLFGRKDRPIEGGVVALADENYIRESILEPNAKKAAGFTNAVMPTFQGLLNEDDIGSIIEFIKTLK